MLTKELAKLLRTSDNLNYFRNKIYDEEADALSKLDENETLFHVLIRSKSISDTLKNKYIYVLSDVGIDINAQNSTSQTCLHLAAMNSQIDILNTLLQCGSDLTIVDHSGLCAYNYARRLKDKDLSRKIILIMQPYYPTYWIGIENNDMNVIRRLANSWCKFDIKKNDKYLIDFARERSFVPAVALFNSLGMQMDLCFAVMAGNVKKVQNIILNHQSELLLNFKNMKEKGSTVLSYAIRENNYDILKSFIQFKPNVLNEIERDEKDIDFPIYFSALKNKINLRCIELLTPEVDPKQRNISDLFYKGSSVLRYAIELNLPVETIETLMQSKYCSKELITVRDSAFMTCRDYTVKNDLNEYTKLVDRIAVTNIIHNKQFRMQLALNGYDFNNPNLEIENKSLTEYAKDNELAELKCFLENVSLYQKKVIEFHDVVEKNDYHAVKALSKADFEMNQFAMEDIFIPSLIESKKNNESQSVFHKAVLNSYFNILEAVLELYSDSAIKVSTKMDQIRDHCQRTPMHYACGFTDNSRIIQLLSHFGFSNNVFDKDGNSPLDFEERNSSQQVKDLIELHRLQDYNSPEPNPWTWQVWTNLQREKKGLKQLIPISSLNAYGHGHSHSGHGHSHSGHGHSHAPHGHSHNSQGVCTTEDHNECENSEYKNDGSYCIIN